MYMYLDNGIKIDIVLKHNDYYTHFFVILW